jgi:hypothetical protein
MSNKKQIVNLKEVSSEYFAHIRQLRDGNELFNVTGEKVKLLKDVIEKNAKKIKDREELKHAPSYQIRRVNQLLEQRKLELVRKRMRDSLMSNGTKYAILGDEFRLRQEIENGYPINFRDSVVSYSHLLLYTFSHSLSLLCYFFRLAEHYYMKLHVRVIFQLSGCYVMNIKRKLMFILSLEI